MTREPIHQRQQEVEAEIVKQEIRLRAFNANWRTTSRRDTEEHDGGKSRWRT
jgi:hypothetical protein